jgi:L-methionine (R)-S-oxide reductase
MSAGVAFLNVMQKDYSALFSPPPIDGWATPVCYLVHVSRDRLLSQLENIVVTSRDRHASVTEAAVLIRSSGNYRWVGLYDVDHAAGLVRNVSWNGPGAPAHPTFPLTQGLTSAAIAQRQIVNVGDVSTDPRYLTAFGTTRSEIIVPVFDRTAERVLGTIDVESEKPHAFTLDIEDLLAACSKVIQPLWDDTH